MGTIFNILDIVDKITIVTQDRAAKEKNNKTFREILEEEINKLDKNHIDTRV